MKDNFIVKIISLNEGMKQIENVRLIRIKSKDYNLLIMRDYLPIIGMIEGNIEIETVDKKNTFNDIEAYYVSSNNVFELIIKEKHG